MDRNRRYALGMSEVSPPGPGPAAKSRARPWVVGLVAVFVVTSVVGALLAIPHGSAAERAAEAARIREEITAAFESAGVAPRDLQSWAVEEPCHFFLPEPWKGTHSSIQVTTYAAVEPADVVAALGVVTRDGGAWVDVEGERADHTVAFTYGGSARVGVTSQTGCYAE